MQKWPEEIEEILRKHHQGNIAKRIIKLADLAEDVKVPSGDHGEVVILMLKSASEDLQPLAAVYAGFQLGVAWERLNKEKADAK